jgi:predicted enzyme related to lactoylglutathione lyase
MTARNTGQTGGSSVSAAEKLTVVRSVRSIPMHAGYHRSARLSECLRFFKMGCFVQNLTDDRARATWLRPDRLSERVASLSVRIFERVIHQGRLWVERGCSHFTDLGTPGADGTFSIFFDIGKLTPDPVAPPDGKLSDENYGATGRKRCQSTVQYLGPIVFPFLVGFNLARFKKEKQESTDEHALSKLETSMSSVQIDQKSYAMPPKEGISIAHFLTVADVNRSAHYYEKVFGARILTMGDGNAPPYLQLANIWMILNVGGGPTPDKPTVTLSVPDPNHITSFMNFRVADIQACYELWKSRGAEFITPPIPKYGEIRCYIRDPDGYIIEVGQSTDQIYG